MDQFENLPEELKFLLISHVSDIYDISKLEITSPNFKFYVKNITNNRVIDVSVEKFSPFNNLEIIDHKIIIHINFDNVNYLDNLQFLRRAHFRITYSNLLPLILSKLSQLSSSVYYFKISCELPEHLVGIFLKNKKYLVLPNRMKVSPAVELVSEILGNSGLDIFPIFLPGILSKKSRKPSIQATLTSDKMRKFLREADFGLVDPSKPLSINNPPVNEYTKVIADVINPFKIPTILNLYRGNENMKHGRVTDTIQVFEKLGQYFGPEIPLIYYKYNGPTRNVNLNNLITRNNYILPITIEKMATYNFPDTIPSEDTIFLINEILSTSSNNLRNIRELASTLGTIYYTSDGREIEF